MTRHPLHRTAPVARAAVLTLADDLSTIARLESALRVAAGHRPRTPRADAMRRFADWLARMR